MANRIRILSELTAVLCSLLLIPATTQTARAQQQAPAPASAPEAARIPSEQLDSLVAPIALYPDPLLAQVLAASTYPLELVQLQQWLGQHQDLKDQALADAVAKQDWDPSVQEMAALPDVVKLLTQDIKWTTDLGNAFLAQQSDLMDAVQRMRAKAKGAGKLTSSAEMKVETKVVEDKTVVVIEQANPQVVYVPSYDPVAVYGAPAYPYPPLAYPPVGSGYYAGRAIAFGVGVAVGAAFWHGGWGYGCGWGGHNQININNNNTFVRNSANRPGGQPARGGQGQWQHNPQHRGGAPYGNRDTANRFGGTTRDASAAQRQASARQQLGGAGAQPGGGRQQAGGAGRQQAGGGLQAGAGARQPPAAAQRGGAGGGERVGNRSVSPSAQPRGGGAFGGGSAGYSGGGARASSSRGSASTGGRRGGGGGGRRR